ncbi:MAG: hypothetical protein LBC88_05410 [Spirochaetaceae bacterium]|jgi:hypothetical protein|nr:hypothetical protein [Spirochaetaceae bacterium]
MNKENMEKGIKAEKLFEQYLNSENIPFYRIDQNKESQSEEFKSKNIRRPDYLIHTKRGVFYIDVKYREKKPFGLNCEERFPIDQYNIKTLFQFQEQLHHDVWLAFTDVLNKPHFLYTTISQIYEYYKNIEKLYIEKNYQKFSRVFMYIPNALFSFNRLSFDKGFYNEPDLRYFEEEIEYLRKIANYR